MRHFPLISVSITKDNLEVTNHLSFFQGHILKWELCQYSGIFYCVNIIHRKREKKEQVGRTAL